MGKGSATGAAAIIRTVPEAVPRATPPWATTASSMPLDPASAVDDGERAPRPGRDTTMGVEKASAGPDSRPEVAQAGAASVSAPPWAAGAPASAPMTPPWRAAATTTEGSLQAGGEVVVGPAAGRLLDFSRLPLRLPARVEPAAAGGTRSPLAPTVRRTDAAPWTVGGEAGSSARADSGRAKGDADVCRASTRADAGPGARRAPCMSEESRTPSRRHPECTEAGRLERRSARRSRMACTRM